MGKKKSKKVLMKDAEERSKDTLRIYSRPRTPQKTIQGKTSSAIYRLEDSFKSPLFNNWKEDWKEKIELSRHEVLELLELLLLRKMKIYNSYYEDLDLCWSIPGKNKLEEKLERLLIKVAREELEEKEKK
ncbi:hypothetical protein LCGC14_3017070 [marine sediment metagenome]|uniref:Uncharacterized protein n=1 Tax=marine sediment metagenome TaxID=412755 RepID=A0A0F8Z421_9ZZZZ|nr:hypothetical protein [Nitrosopumilus sp.]